MSNNIVQFNEEIIKGQIKELVRGCDYPPERWTKIRTNNVIERMNREIRRRTRVVGAFPDGNSALMREKWEREDYRTATIDAAIQACSGQFHRSKMEHPYFVVFDENAGIPHIKASLLAKWTREHLHYLLVRDSGKQGVLIYVYQDGVYKLYAPDMLKGIIKGYISDYNEEMVKMNSVNKAFNQLITDTNYISQNELNADEGIIVISGFLPNIHHITLRKKCVMLPLPSGHCKQLICTNQGGCFC